jgi:ATPase subunit of ABC transporter with duplicated ATPase domains
MLDVRAVVWLEQYLKRWPKTLLVVSHDREFLNEVATDIIHLNAKTLTQYKYFSSFLFRKKILIWKFEPLDGVHNTQHTHTHSLTLTFALI